MTNLRRGDKFEAMLHFNATTATRINYCILKHFGTEKHVATEENIGGTT